MSRPSVVLFAHKVLAAYVTAGVQTYMGPPGVDLEQKRRTRCIMCLCLSPNVCISGVTPTRLCHWVRTIGSHRYVYMVNGAGVLVMSAPRSAHAWGGARTGIRRYDCCVGSEAACWEGARRNLQVLLQGLGWRAGAAFAVGSGSGTPRGGGPWRTGAPSARPRVTADGAG